MKKIIIFFHRKKIVYSKDLPPCQFRKAISFAGRKYIVAVGTNQCNSDGSAPMYHIPRHKVVGLRIIPSPFDRLIDRLLMRKRKTNFKFLK